MRALIQRVTSGSVRIAEKNVASIDRGIVVLLGIKSGDSVRDADFLAKKCVHLRIFNDEQGRFEYSVADINADILIVSQFTLYGDCAKGRRPSFTNAGTAEFSLPLYQRFIDQVKTYGLRTVSGKFGADMLVTICNDGPVTILVES